MPRILPRLLNALKNPKGPPIPPKIVVPGIIQRRREAVKSKWHPVPDATRALSPLGRTRSVLLDDVNPVGHRDVFERHLRLPPLVHLPKVPDEFKERWQQKLGDDSARAMTKEERSWWASPYLRMLATPMRTDCATEELLPTDFLVRLSVMYVPGPRGPRTKTMLLPDGIENSRFRHRRHPLGTYIRCKKTAVEEMSARKLMWRSAGSASVHSKLALQIAHLLRLRAIQELTLLAARVQHSPTDARANPVMRRLTRAEWRIVKEEGRVPWKGAVALLVCPPPNRDVSSKQRPEPTASPAPPSEVDVDKAPDSNILPPSVLIPVEAQSDDTEPGEPNLLPKLKVPLYNARSLFPSRSQRAALYQALQAVLRKEGRAQRRTQEARPAADGDASSDETAEPKRARPKGNEKASYTYLIYSDEGSLLRADTVPVAIALWRLRMWEGGGWDTKYENMWRLKHAPLPS